MTQERPFLPLTTSGGDRIKRRYRSLVKAGWKGSFLWEGPFPGPGPVTHKKSNRSQKNKPTRGIPRNYVY